MTEKVYADLLTEQEKEMGFNLVYLPAMFYLLHETHGILRAWYDEVDTDELAELIQEYIDKP